jgi:FkbM family methyltransferase
MKFIQILTRTVLRFRANRLLQYLFYPVYIFIKIILRLLDRKTRFYNELLSNVESGSLIVRIHEIPGLIEIDIRSHILQKILINKNYEPAIVAMIKFNLDPHKDAINIGANVGIYTILMASMVSIDNKVLAIEPVPLVFGYLIKNLIRNDLDKKVVIYNGICIDKKGEYDLNVIEGKEEYSCIGDSYHHKKINEKIIRIGVEGETINNLVRANQLYPGIIVIDVEGAEMKVLEGANTVLIEHRPIIIMELVDELLRCNGSSSGEVIKFLNDSGYFVEVIIGNKNLNFPFSGNIIARPREKVIN